MLITLIESILRYTEYELIANGTPIEILGSGSRSSLRGRKFDIRYDSLPDQLESLEIVMKEFVGYEMLEVKITLASIGDEPICSSW